MSNVIIIVQDYLERITTELMRDREERHKERRTTEERNQNRERHKRGMERLNLGKNGTGRREKQYELD